MFRDFSASEYFTYSYFGYATSGADCVLYHCYGNRSGRKKIIIQPDDFSYKIVSFITFKEV